MRALAALLLAALATFPGGCSGCRSDGDRKDAQESPAEKEKEKEKQRQARRPDFEPPRWMGQPNHLDRAENYFKPGHWSSATVELQANHFDFNGRLVIEPVDLPGVPFRLGSSRPAILPKEQRRLVEAAYFVPVGPVPTAPWPLAARLASAGGQSVQPIAERLRPLMEHQYYVVVLARGPDRYRYLHDLPAFSGRSQRGEDDEMLLIDGSDSLRTYRVVVPARSNRVPLPENVLCWTSIAYLIWDDLEPQRLTDGQWTALLDWLHWGGQLVISGPESLDSLRSTPLADRLPPFEPKLVELAAQRVDALGERWTAWGEPLRGTGWSGVEFSSLEKSPYRFVPGTEELLVERAVGRGRIVVSAFRLGQQSLAQCTGFDGLVHACLLRRPPRAFRVRGGATEILINGEASWGEAEHSTRLRFFSRDTGRKPVPATPWGDPEDAYQAEAMWDPVQQQWLSAQTAAIQPGPAGWRDFNAVADSARTVLARAAGVKVPDAGLVLGLMIGYIVAAVGLNAGVGYLLGRLEWSWAMLPVLAVGFSALVLYATQADIGFSRAENEVAVVEMFAGHPRAHVTRYTAVYNSLATDYTAYFADSGAASLPFPAEDQAADAIPSSRRTLELRYGPQPRDGARLALDGFLVPSNTTRMLHSEHMLDLGGSFYPAGEGLPSRVTNTTGLALQGAVVVRPVSGQSWQAAWIGALGPGESKSLDWSAPKQDAPKTVWQRMQRDVVLPPEA